MDVEKVFHMTGGNGMNSYAKNSSLQKKASEKVKHIIIETVEELYLATTPKSLGIADLGCSCGPNTLSIIRDIIQAIQGLSLTHNINTTTTTSEFRIYLNDLPTNDFNSIFKAFPDFLTLLCRNDHTNTKTASSSSPSIFMGAYPGSFYGRLFPNNSLHFVHSSHCLHWLSRVPPQLYDEQGNSLNKACIYICESSPQIVAQAYCKQFREDFSRFLGARSEELVGGGRMVLIFLGRRGPQHVDTGNSFFWEILTRSFAILISKGEVEKEKVDSYDVHFYAASKEEIEEEVRREGSFELERIEMSEIDKSEEEGRESYGKKVAKTVRAIQESMISNHFGESILDSLFHHFATLLDQELATHDIHPITFVLVLTKKSSSF